MKILKNKTYAVLFTIIVVSMWLYFAIASGDTLDPRWTDGALNFNEMYWYEKALFILGFPLNFMFVFCAWIHAWKSKRFNYLIAALFIWPVSFYYVLKFVTEPNGEKNS